jgi:hypothetical protein
LRQAANSVFRSDTDVTITNKWVDTVLTALLREFKLADGNLNSDPGSVKHSLSMFAFVAPGADSVQFQQRFDRENRLICQEAVNEATAKMDKKTTELFIAGSLKTGDDVIATLANFRQLGLLITADYDESECHKVLTEYAKGGLLSIYGREFIGLSSAVRQVPVNMLLEVQQIFGRYGAIGKISEYRDAVTNGEPIHPRVYADAMVFAKVIMTEAHNAFQRLDSRHYSDRIPVIVDYLPHLAIFRPGQHGAAYQEYQPPAQGQPRGQNQGGGRVTPLLGDLRRVQIMTPPAAVGDPVHIRGGGGGGRGGGAGAFGAFRREGDPRAGNGGAGGGDIAAIDEAKKTKGFLTYTPPAGSRFPTPPPCPVFIQIGNMPGKERVCMRFCAQGLFCPTTSRCQLAHVAAFDRLPADVQEAFKTYVTRTPGLAFAPGQGPSGTP